MTAVVSPAAPVAPAGARALWALVWEADRQSISTAHAVYRPPAYLRLMVELAVPVGMGQLVIAMAAAAAAAAAVHSVVAVVVAAVLPVSVVAAAQVPEVAAVSALQAVVAVAVARAKAVLDVAAQEAELVSPTIRGCRPVVQVVRAQIVRVTGSGVTAVR